MNKSISFFRVICLLISVIAIGCEFVSSDQASEIEKTRRVIQVDETIDYRYRKQTRILENVSFIDQSNESQNVANESVNHVEQQIANIISTFDLSQDPNYRKVKMAARRLRISEAEMAGIRKAIVYAAAFDLERLSLRDCPQDYVSTLARMSEILEMQLLNLDYSVYVMLNGGDMSQIINQRYQIATAYQSAKNEYAQTRAKYM